MNMLVFVQNRETKVKGGSTGGVLEIERGGAGNEGHGLGSSRAVLGGGVGPAAGRYDVLAGRPHIHAAPIVARDPRRHPQPRVVARCGSHGYRQRLPARILQPRVSLRLSCSWDWDVMPSWHGVSFGRIAAHIVHACSCLERFTLAIA